jgi:hypothetical protein
MVEPTTAPQAGHPACELVGIELVLVLIVEHGQDISTFEA